MENRSNQTQSTDQPASLDNDSQVCPDCETALLKSVSHEPPHCPACGLIVEQRHSVAPAAPGAEIADQQHPQTQVITQTQLNTTIGDGNTTTSDSHRLARLRNRQTEANYREKEVLAYGCQEIQRMGSQLAVPDDLQNASAHLVKTAQETDNIGASSIEAIAAAALYAILRQNEVPRTQTELATVAKVDQDKIRQASSALNNRLNLELPPPRAVNYVDRFADKIESQCDVTLTTETRHCAQNLLTHTADAQLCGKKPTVLTAASLYAACYLTDTSLSTRNAETGCDVTRDAITSWYPTLLAAHPTVDLSPSEITDTRSRQQLTDRLPTLDQQSSAFHSSE